MAGHDSLTPGEIATLVAARGATKADASTIPTFVLALVPGAFIAVGAWFVYRRSAARGAER
jgi:formate/nitrite transporter FocA (FNT family)